MLAANKPSQDGKRLANIDRLRGEVELDDAPAILLQCLRNAEREGTRGDRVVIMRWLWIASLFLPWVRTDAAVAARAIVAAETFGLSGPDSGTVEHRSGPRPRRRLTERRCSVPACKGESNVSEVQHSITDPLTTELERPVCEKCRRRMEPARIEPDTPGIERHLFECECGHSQTMLVSSG